MFNSLKYAKKLEEAGVPRAQAEVHMQIMVEIVETTLATKQDLKDLGLALNQDMKDLSVELRQDMKDLGVEIGKEFQEFRHEVGREFQEVRRDIKDVEVRMDTKFDQLENRIFVRLGRLMVAGITVYSCILGAVIAFANYSR